MQDDHYDSQLQQLWSQNQRYIARKFLQKAIHSNMTLADLKTVLQFSQVSTWLTSLRLQDVFTEAIDAIDAAALPPTTATAATSTTQRRERRSPAQIEVIKLKLWRLLQEASVSLDNSQLATSLAASGYRVDRITLKRLLLRLEAEKKISNVGGRPQAWQSCSPVAAQQAIGSL